MLVEQLELLEFLEFAGELGVVLGGVVEGLEGGLGVGQAGLFVGGEFVVFDGGIEAEQFLLQIPGFDLGTA